MDAPLVARAFETAALAHRGQTRKAGRAPYVVHPLRVVGRLLAWGVTDEAALAAAALHDVVEDTHVTLADLERDFGRPVARLVEALTHPHGLPHDERTRVILAKIEEAPLEVALVKLADRLDNIHEMQGWRPASRLGYLGEAAAIADAARRRLAQGDGDAATRAALGRALPEYDAAVARRRQEAEQDAAARRR